MCMPKTIGDYFFIIHVMIIVITFSYILRHLPARYGESVRRSVKCIGDFSLIQVVEKMTMEEFSDDEVYE